jgi:hypothetical protein
MVGMLRKNCSVHCGSWRPEPAKSGSISYRPVKAASGYSRVARGNSRVFGMRSVFEAAIGSAMVERPLLQQLSEFFEGCCVKVAAQNIGPEMVKKVGPEMV